ncbi:MAG: copper amine oxidase N-terminal domain-containing protein [Anaerotignum sp.]|nr:copper amine oxidase N-terminal domain-containing protein [Anaerotignum sp.]
MKRMISMITAALLAVGMSTTAFAADINVTVDGTPVAWTDAKPFIDENSRTLVPLRPIAKALGLEVSWNDDTNTASFTDGTTTVDFIVDSPEYRAYMNGYGIYAYTEMDTKAVIRDSRIFAPARYLAESFRYNVGWEDATKSVTITKIAEEKEPTVLPEVPAGQIATAAPVTAEAGSSGLTYIVFDGVTLVDDPDIFEYSIDIDSTLNGLGAGYGFADGRVEMDLMPDLALTPGTYPVTFTIDKGFFSDAKEDVVVSTTLTVTAPKAETVLERVLEDLEWGVETTYGANAAEITEAVLESFSWMLEESPFRLTLTEGDWSYDSEGNILRELWECTVTVTNTETGESASASNVLIPLTFDPESAW